MPGGKKRHSIAAGLLLILAGGFLLLLTLRSSQPPSSRRLPDGTVVTIRKVSFGKVHKLVIGNRWQQLAEIFLPAKFRARFGINVIAFTNAANSTVIFIETVATNGALNSSPGFSPFALVKSSVRLTDDVGNQLFLKPGPVLNPSSTIMVESFTAPLVSHRARHLDLQVRHRDEWNLRLKEGQVDFTVPNPAPHTGPHWKAQPLPLTSKCEDLQVELIELQTNFGMRLSYYAHAALDTNLHTRARIRILQNGTESAVWHPINVAVLDEEGNGFSQRISPFSETGWLEFIGGFSNLEPRKFRFELYHDPPFSTNEEMTFHAVPIPASKTSGQSVSATFEGFKILFQFSNRNNFNYYITPEPVGFHTYLKVERSGTDGKTPPFRDGECPSWQGSGCNFPADVGAVDITFTISSNRFVEFIAKPSPLGTNAPPLAGAGRIN